MITRRPNMAPEKTAMAQRPLPERLNSFEEVYLGYTLEEAQAEAERCLNCPDRYCAVHCPAHNYIPEFIAEIRNGDLEAAWQILARTNPMMEIAGRVCPCEQQCESHCTRGIRHEPVAIGRLERFVADWYRRNRTPNDPKPEMNGRSVAVVGAGPAGLACAASLILSGFKVTVFEKSQTLGGVPVWGIPSFVLPPVHMQNQVEMLKNRGVEFRCGVELGRDIRLAQLRSEYDAVFVATGAGKPVSLIIKGWDLPGVVQAADYLKQPDAYEGKKVLVIGGGNTAIDAARCALRRGTESVKILYRRTLADMPATADEKAIALEEGAEILCRLSPAAFLGREGKLCAVECDQMALCAPDYPGGRNNVTPSGQKERLDADLAILALGFETDMLPDLPTDARGRILVSKTYATELDGVYAGGDAVTGAATLMKAVAAGKDAAAAIFTRFAE